MGFPEISFPDDNTYTYNRWLLGKKLFYSTALSRDESISCGTCHIQSNAFADDVAFTPGVDNAPGKRNAPTLTNVAYNPYFLTEGGSATLETQIAIPIQEHNEFDFNIILIAERLNQDEELLELSDLAYGRGFDPFVITRSIANFERSIISGNSNYDKYYYQNNNSILSPSEINGMNLFNGAANCSECHGSFNFTNYSFENNGLYEVYQDSGRYRLTQLEEDIARFKVPTLRNVEYSAPYMHDGSIESLEEVIEHYSTGIQNHPNTNAILQNLYLSQEQKTDLVNFLKTLSDEDFINDQKFQP